MTIMIITGVLLTLIFSVAIINICLSETFGDKGGHIHKEDDL